MKPKPRFSLTLEGEHDTSDPDGYRRVKLLLKRLLRSHNLKCVAIAPAKSKQCSDVGGVPIGTD